MPTIFKAAGFRFYFFTNEGNEPCHVHVTGHGGEAKFWVPSCEVVFSHGLKASDLRKILAIIESRKREIEEKWNEIHQR